jgi:signal transduction histidine kinase
MRSALVALLLQTAECQAAADAVGPGDVWDYVVGVGAGKALLIVADRTQERRVDELRRNFVVNASHELKTPVAGIQALSESLAFALDRSPDRARAMIRRLQIESERLSQLVRDLLDLSRLEEGDAPARRQRVDLGQLVYVQLDRLSRYAADRDVKLHVDCPTPVRVVGNPADLRRIEGALATHPRPPVTCHNDLLHDSSLNG